MATIFSQPNPTGNCNCAVLSPQENYYFPFLSNIGNWTQIRVGALMSYCGSGGFQSGPTAETLTLSAANLAWYFGVGNFSSPLGLLTPLSTGCNFVGTSTYGGTQTVLALGIANGSTNIQRNGSNFPYFLCSNGTNFINTTSLSLNFPVFPPSGNTG